MLSNIICFQLGWFSCVLGAASDHAWLGVLASICLIAWHLKVSNNWIGEGYLIILAMLIGFVFDFLPLNFGWISFESLALWPDHIPPPWMIFLWGMFATTLNVSLNWLKTRSIVAMLLGALAGPLAYWGGARLGALEIVDFSAAMIYLSIGWAVAVPALLKIASSITLSIDLKNGRKR